MTLGFPKRFWGHVGFTARVFFVLFILRELVELANKLMPLEHYALICWGFFLLNLTVFVWAVWRANSGLRKQMDFWEGEI